MPGWLIQGVRGEGKSLAAVNKIREYALQGKPIATNLDIYVDKLLPPENTSLIYRLPDHPRLEDLELLPPAYDVKYKGQDHNGLLVLDEMATWFNSRSWNDKTRLKLIAWLLLSRKRHWDIILLAQDYEMIDAQARTSLCEFLVQSTVYEKEIPYFSKITKPLLPNSKPEFRHKYFVYYGMSMQQNPKETWEFDKNLIIHGYDTNQLFKEDIEVYNSQLVDMRATYTYLPANYLSGLYHLDKIKATFDQLQKNLQTNYTLEKPMAAKSKLNENHFAKPVLIFTLLLCFIGYRYLIKPYFSDSKETSLHASTVSNNSSSSASFGSTTVNVSKSNPLTSSVDTLQSFISDLFTNRQIHVTTIVTTPDKGLLGRLDFYTDGKLTESITIKQLEDMGVVISNRSYGLQAYLDGKFYKINNFSSIPSPKVIPKDHDMF